MSSQKTKPAPGKMIRWLLTLFVIGLLLRAGFRPRPVEVDVAPVSRGTLQITVDEDGETRIREPYLISAPLAGRLMRVELEPGDSISKNQIIASIDPGAPGLLDVRSQAEAEARVKVTEAAHARALTQLDIARAHLEKAQRYFERDKGLLAKGNIAKPSLDDTEHALRVARSNASAAESALDVSKFEMEQAKAALLHSRSLDNENTPSGRQFEIRSPIDGVVLRQFKESSTMVPAAEGILEIGDPDDLEIRIDVLSEDAVKITPGQSVELENWGGSFPLKAHIRRVEPSAFTKVSALGVDEQRVWVYADFIDQGDQSDDLREPELTSGKTLLGDGYRVEARIVVWEKDDVIKAPSGALFREEENDRWAVYRIEDEKAILTPVTRGKDNGIEAEIQSGLSSGDRVILHPGDKIQDGVAVLERK